jgi:hypothetical protein
LNLLVENLVVAAVATLAFGLIRNFLAIIPLVLLYGLVWMGFVYLTTPDAPVWQSRFWWYAVSQGLWVLTLFALLELSLHFIKSLLPALLTAMVANALLMFGFSTTMASFFLERPTSFKVRLLFLPFTLLGCVLQALALYGGLRLTAGRAALEEPPPSPRISKGYYLGTMAGAEVVSAIVSVAVIVFILTGVWKMRPTSAVTLTFALLGVAGLLSLYAAVVFCRMIYKMWAVIQDGCARTGPGKAVGALFIPFYNLYWMFQVFPGFATDYNAFAERHALNLPRLSTSVFTAYAVLCLFAAIPYVGLLFVPAALVVLLVMTARVCDAVNAVPFAAPAPVSPLMAEEAVLMPANTRL